MTTRFLYTTTLFLVLGCSLFTKAESILSQPAGTLSATEATSGGAGSVGADLFQIHCASCHLDDGSGKVGIAPSIRNQDFLALASDHFIKETIRQGRPGTAMVARPDLSDEDLDSIIAFLRTKQSPNTKSIPVDDSKVLSGDRENGGQLFTNYCSACHGPYGEGYMLGLPGTGIGLPGFLGVASDDYIFQTIKHGRLGTPMQSFIGAKGLANLSEKDAHDIISHLRHLGDTYEERMANMPVGPGNANAGEVHFNINCAACHQTGGSGKVGLAPSIRNQDFLSIASDDFIRQTITGGRAGTGMMARPDLHPQTVNDIIAYLRQTKHERVELNVDQQIRGDAEAGRDKYNNFCASCHGLNGEGYAANLPGTSIGLPGFLNAASDDYIFQTLKRGRIGTPMRAFLGAKGLANLSNEDAADIISHLRTLESSNSTTATQSVSDFE